MELLRYGPFKGQEFLLVRVVPCSVIITGSIGDRMVPPCCF